MSTKETLRKMILATRQESGEVSDMMLTALDGALGQTGRVRHEIDAGLTDGVLDMADLPALIEDLPDPGLVFLLRDGGDVRGLICFDGLLVNGVIEVMTRAPDKQVFREARVPTKVDVGLSRLFLAQLLPMLKGAVREESGRDYLTALEVGDAVNDRADLAFMLPKGKYARASGRLWFQDGQRGGTLTLVLNNEIWDHNHADPVRETAWAAQMRANTRAARLRLKAVLTVIDMPLGKARRLRAGDVLPFYPSALSDISLQASDGTTCLKGRLGQVNGLKAVCLEGAGQGGEGGSWHAAALPQEVGQGAQVPEMPAEDLHRPMAGDEEAEFSPPHASADTAAEPAGAEPAFAGFDPDALMMEGLEDTADA